MAGRTHWPRGRQGLGRRLLSAFRTLPGSRRCAALTAWPNGLRRRAWLMTSCNRPRCSSGTAFAAESDLPTSSRCWRASPIAAPGTRFDPCVENAAGPTVGAREPSVPASRPSLTPASLAKSSARIRSLDPGRRSNLAVQTTIHAADLFAAGFVFETIDWALEPRRGGGLAGAPAVEWHHASDARSRLRKAHRVDRQGAVSSSHRTIDQ
jgi:hypothetical protein